jgi:poly-beta-hydroxyalkanoate depolymerase
LEGPLKGQLEGQFKRTHVYDFNIKKIMDCTKINVETNILFTKEYCILKKIKKQLNKKIKILE